MFLRTRYAHLRCVSIKQYSISYVMCGRSSLLCDQSAFFHVDSSLDRHYAIRTGTISRLLCCRCGYLVAPSIGDEVGIMPFGRYTTCVSSTYACRWLTCFLGLFGVLPLGDMIFYTSCADDLLFPQGFFTSCADYVPFCAIGLRVSRR